MVDGRVEIDVIFCAMNWLPVARCDERHVVDGHADYLVSDFFPNSDEVELLLLGEQGK